MILRRLLSNVLLLPSVVTYQSTAAFAIGCLSGHHHLPCGLHRLAEAEFDLYVFTTYAHDQLASLMDAALEYGVHLEAIR